jgi:uncharacterized phage protein gp47/JayE
MTWGIISSGFNKKRLEDILPEIDTSLKSALGSDLNLLPTSVVGQFRSIFAEREALLWDLMEAVYNSAFPDTASNASLDNAVAYLGLVRKPATKSTVTLRVSGSNGTVVPVGFVASSGVNTDRFLTTQSGTITGGYVDLLAACEEAGAISAVSGTLTTVDTPVFGVSSVTNQADATVGQNRETDAELRLRRLSSLSSPGNGTVDRIRESLLAIPDVTRAFVIENVEMTTDIDGRPAKSFEAYVAGGTEAAIGGVIWETKPAGIQTWGTVTVPVLDSEGGTQSVKFSRPVDKPVYITVAITKNTNPLNGPIYPTGGDALVETAILDFANSYYDIGLDVITSLWYGPINTIPGVIGIDIKQGFSPAPSSGANLSITAFELATFDSGRITVTSS